MAFPLTSLGAALLHTGEAAQAVQLLRRAVRLRTDRDVAPELLAHSRFTLARALWDAPTGEGRDEALELAHLARATQQALGGQRDLADIDAWLGSHRPE